MEMGEAELKARRIQFIVANNFRMDLEVLLSRRKNRKYSYPRMLAMYLVKEITHGSYPWVALQFGGLHHTSVMHACRWARDNEQYREYISGMLATLRR